MDRRDKRLEGLMRLSTNFRPARMLLSACELDLFDHLEKAASAKDVARRLKTEERATGILLDGLAALGLIEKEGGRYRNGEAVSTYLVSGKPDYRGAIFKHHAHCWEGWSGLTATLKKGHPASTSGRSAAETRNFILGMHAVARDLAARIAGLLPLPQEGHLLDVGGGPATYSMAFCRARPHLQSTLFDRPEVTRIARQMLQTEGRDVAPRIRLKGGDFTADALGRTRFDFVWISHIFHAYPEETCQALTNDAFKALKPGGVLAVHEFALNEDKTAPLWAAVFSVHMLVNTAEGRAYSRGEIAGWMRQAGFQRVRAKKASPHTSLIIGLKP